MYNLNITKEDLLTRYNEKVDKILDVCDWKTSFAPEEICELICGIIFETDGNIYSPRVVYDLYMAEIEALDLKKGEWQEKYNRQDIVYMIYDIIDEIELYS